MYLNTSEASMRQHGARVAIDYYETSTFQHIRLPYGDDVFLSVQSFLLHKQHNEQKR